MGLVHRCAAFLPKRSASDSRILLTRFRDPSVGLYSFDLGVRWILISISSLLFQEGQQEEFKIVYDCTNYSFSHVMKNPLSSFKNYLDFGQVTQCLILESPQENSNVKNYNSFSTNVAIFFSFSDGEEHTFKDILNIEFYFINWR